MNQLSEITRQTIAALEKCHRVCASTAMLHCLETGREHAKPQHIRLMMDCSAMCHLTAAAFGRKSQYQTQFAELCADICDTCAADCGNLGDMEECISACEECARLCHSNLSPQDAEKMAMAARLPPS